MVIQALSPDRIWRDVKPHTARGHGREPFASHSRTQHVQQIRVALSANVCFDCETQHFLGCISSRIVTSYIVLCPEEHFAYRNLSLYIIPVDRWILVLGFYILTQKPIYSGLFLGHDC